MSGSRYRVAFAHSRTDAPAPGGDEARRILYDKFPQFPDPAYVISQEV